MWRWVTLWESTCTREEALQDGCTSNDESDPLSCPDLVFELKCWIKQTSAQGGQTCVCFYMYLTISKFKVT